MKNIFTSIPVLSLFLLISSGLSAQQGTVTSGAELKGTGGAMSVTVGQMDFIQLKSDGGLIAQGQQHHLEVSLINNIEPTEEAYGISVFPNPTVQQLTLTLADVTSGDMAYRIADTNGQLLTTQTINDLQTLIAFDTYAAATYLITITQNNRPVKTFRIIKSDK